MIKSLRRVILQRGISMNRTLSLVLAGVLVLGIFAGGCAPVGPTPSTEKVLARIDGVSIFADNCSPPQYFAKVLDLEGGCNQFDSYNVTRAENTTIVVTVFNRLLLLRRRCDEIMMVSLMVVRPRSYQGSRMSSCGDFGRKRK
jgi:hypothetical protein